MASRVLSVRLEETAIAYCFQLLSDSGVNTARMGMSTAVKLIASGVIAQQLRLGALKEIAAEDAAKWLAKRETDNVPEISFTTPTLADALKEVAGIEGGEEELITTEQATGEPNTGRTTEEFLADFATRTQPDVGQDVEITDDADMDVVGDTNKARDKLMEMKFTPLTELFIKSPKDRILTGFQDDDAGGSEEQRSLFQRCIEVIYTVMPQEEWGSAKAQQHIQSLYEDVM